MALMVGTRGHGYGPAIGVLVHISPCLVDHARLVCARRRGADLPRLAARCRDYLTVGTAWSVRLGWYVLVRPGMDWYMVGWVGTW